MSPNSSRKVLAKRVLEFGKLNWPSIQQIVADINEPEPQRLRMRLPLAVRRLLSSVFKKKQKPVAV